MEKHVCHLIMKSNYYLKYFKVFSVINDWNTSLNAIAEILIIKQHLLKKFCFSLKTGKYVQTSQSVDVTTV